MDASLTASTVADDGLSVASIASKEEQQFEVDTLVSVLVLPSLVKFKIPLPTFTMPNDNQNRESVKEKDAKIIALMEKVVKLQKENTQYAEQDAAFAHKEAALKTQVVELKKEVEELQEKALTWRKSRNEEQTAPPSPTLATVGSGSQDSQSAPKSLSKHSNVSSGAATYQAQEVMDCSYMQKCKAVMKYLENKVFGKDNPFAEYAKEETFNVMKTLVMDPSIPQDQGAAESVPEIVKRKTTTVAPAPTPAHTAQEIGVSLKGATLEEAGVLENGKYDRLRA